MWILALKGLTLHLLTMKTVMCYWKFTLLLLYYYVQLFPFLLLPAAVIFVIDSTNIERISEAHEELAKLMAEKRLKDALLLIFANKQVHVCLKKPFFFMISSIVLQLQYYMQKRAFREAAWPSGQRSGLAIRWSRVRVPVWPLAGFVLGRPEFKFSATLVNSQLVAFCQLGFLILLCCI